jgi:hypothetical protein
VSTSVGLILKDCVAKGDVTADLFDDDSFLSAIGKEIKEREKVNNKKRKQKKKENE